MFNNVFIHFQLYKNWAILLEQSFTARMQVLTEHKLLSLLLLCSANFFMQI